MISRSPAVRTGGDAVRRQRASLWLNSKSMFVVSRAVLDARPVEVQEAVSSAFLVDAEELQVALVRRDAAVTTDGTAVSSFVPCPNELSLVPDARSARRTLGDGRPVDRRTRVVELRFASRVDLEVAARKAHLGVARQGRCPAHERKDHDEPHECHPSGPGSAAAALQCHCTFLDTVVCACSPDVTSGSRRTSALSPLRMSAPFPGRPSHADIAWPTRPGRDHCGNGSPHVQGARRVSRPVTGPHGEDASPAPCFAGRRSAALDPPRTARSRPTPTRPPGSTVDERAPRRCVLSTGASYPLNIPWVPSRRAEWHLISWDLRRMLAPLKYLSRARFDRAWAPLWPRCWPRIGPRDWPATWPRSPCAQPVHHAGP